MQVMNNILTGIEEAIDNQKDLAGDALLP